MTHNFLTHCGYAVTFVLVLFVIGIDGDNGFLACLGGILFVCLVLSLWIGVFRQAEGDVHNLIYALLAALSGVGIVLYRDVPSWKDFGVGLCTNMIALIVAVAVIDTLRRVANMEKERPRRIARYERICDINDWLYSLWKILLSQAATPADQWHPATVREFYSMRTFEQMCHVDMRLTPPVYPPSSWPALIWREWHKINTSATALLADPNIEADVYRLLHTITTAYMFWTLEEITVDSVANGNRFLGSYWGGPDDIFIRGCYDLSSWCVRERQALRDNTIRQPSQLLDFVPAGN